MKGTLGIFKLSRTLTRNCSTLSKRAIVLYFCVCGSIIVFQICSYYSYFTRQNKTNRAEKVLLVLSTSLTDSPFKRLMNSNTLSLWAQLGPQVRPVLYVEPDDPCCIDIPSKWHKHAIPEKGSSELPVLRSMLLHSMELYDADFYGFANGDILFGSDLIATITAIKSNLPYLNKPLLVGRRTNVRFDDFENINSLFFVDDIVRVAHEKGELFRHSAEDYFITSKGGFDWRAIPHFVIGRRGFDNWIVAHALTNKYTVIDVTNTVTALHQTGIDGNWAGHRHSDSNINMKISGPFNFRRGFLFCVTHQTDFDMHGNVWIRRRSTDSSFC